MSNRIAVNTDEPTIRTNMSSMRSKSILKAPTVDLFDEVEEPRTATRAELLFDQIVGPEVVTYSKKMDTYSNRNRKPLTAMNNNRVPDLRPIDSSLSDVEFNDTKDKDFEPSAKTSRTRIKKAMDKQKNRVKFAESPAKRVNKKPQSKKNKDYPNPTREAVLEAFQRADLPDFDEIAKYPLHVSKYTDRADPPTPPMHRVMAPFRDLLPSGWENDSSLFDEHNVMLGSAQTKSCGEPSTQGNAEIVTDDVPIDQNLCENPVSESAKTSVNQTMHRSRNRSRLDFRRDSLKTAGVGASRIASTPVQRRHNVTLKNISPISSTVSPEMTSPTNDASNQNTFVKPQSPKNKKSFRRALKMSVPRENIALEIVEPSLSDLDKVALSYNRRTGRLSRTIIESPEKSFILTDSPKIPIPDESSIIVEEPNNTQIANPFNAFGRQYRSHSTRSQTKPKDSAYELSSVFNPKIKSTPLVSSSKYQLIVDRSNLDISMAKMCRSMSLSLLKEIQKTTTIVPVLENTSKPKTRSKRKTINVYNVYRKSIASVVSALNKTCRPSRTVIRVSDLMHSRSEEDCDTTIHSVLDNKSELKNRFDQSLSTSMFSKSMLIKSDNQLEKTIILTPKSKVLLYCEPNEVIDFKEGFDKQVLNKCRKIGEGSYGEVFASRVKDQDIVIKIIPLVQNQNQTENDLFAQILPELVISLNFNRLKTGFGGNKAPNYIDMVRAMTTRGEFPQKLVQEWDKFDQQRHSENEDPRTYTKDQLYIVFFLANGGQDFENYSFDSAVETLSVFAQLALALAAAERALEFEHRDLHWGNVLIANTNQKSLHYMIDGVDYNVNPRGVFASIIDFSLSRITDKEFIIFDDLSKYSDLFAGSGDYQFDIYRMMRSFNGDKWQRFVPKTNVFWLHYILDKAIAAKKYKKFRTTDHKQTIQLLKAIKDTILEFDSAADLIRSQQFSQYLTKLN